MRQLSITAGKSLVVDSPVNIQRVSVADTKLAEAVAISPREVLINGVAPGETSVLIWQQGGNRLVFDLSVKASSTKLDAVREELRHELPDADVTLTFENNTPFLRGNVKDLVEADRAEAIANTLGKTVNLLRVAVPPVEQQILLKVRFANVDRAATSELGANLFSTGALNTAGSVGTGQFSVPKVLVDNQKTTFSLSDALNVFLFRRDINLGSTIKALESRRLLEVLAEPNVLAINNKPASFVAGGEFPFPTLQGGGAGLGAVTIQFREFGVRINFLPKVTPRGTIRLQVAPEVSSLDFANGLVFQGFNIPALSTRRVTTEIELETGQSFVIGGLLDNRTTETLNKIPGLAAIPLLGKIFQSRALSRNKSELLVLVTPEIVRPIPAGQKTPDIDMPKEFMKEGTHETPRTPGILITGPVPVKPVVETIPVEELIKLQKPATPAQAPTQYVPIPMAFPQQPSSTAPAGPQSSPATPGSGAGEGGK